MITEFVLQAARSLYRLQLLHKNQAPQICINTESQILTSKLSKLNVDEIRQLAMNYRSIYNQMKTEDNLFDMEIDITTQKLLSI